MLKLTLAAAICGGLLFGQTDSLHVTATILSQASTKATFGPLGKQYRMAWKLDELRISNTIRSASWLATNAANEASPPAMGSSAPLAGTAFLPVVY